METTRTEIKDSGSRREFSSGAVRDIQAGKGRMDLLPLSTIAKMITEARAIDGTIPFTMSFLYNEIDDFMNTGNRFRIHNVIYSFINWNPKYAGDDYKFSKRVFSAILDLSIHFEQGALKYGEHNWEKGIPAHCYIDSALRHGTKVARGDTDEPHDRAFLWNLICLLWTLDNRPEMNDLPYNINAESNNSDK